MRHDLLASKNCWREIPSSIISREGKTINLEGDIWYLPYSLRNSTIDFGTIEPESVRWVLKQYVIERLERTSIHAGLTSFSEIKTYILKNEVYLKHTSASEIHDKLIAAFEFAIEKFRNLHNLHNLYRSIKWYIYCAEHYPELGFSTGYSQVLESMTIPCNPRGEAVRSEDMESGPLNHSLELPLLIKALKKDQSQEFEHLQEKAALALSIAYGRNPANLTYLRHTDLVNLTPESDSPVFVLRIPRIKKRLMDARNDYIEEFLDPAFAQYIIDLIQANNGKNFVLFCNGKKIFNPQPIFLNTNGNRAAILANDHDNAYNFFSWMITDLIKSFVKRHNIISPVTKELMCVTARRLRYTLATGLAAEGISKAALAKILDHSDTQVVHVYFELAGQIIIHLDKAIAKGYARYLDYFSGNIIDESEDALNGDRPEKALVFKDDNFDGDLKDIGICGESSICHLDPPFSCYLCPKFQPYRHADHEYVLECLINTRSAHLEKYDNARLGIQLDEVIFAVAQVSEACKKENI
jgi:hypothetical protein